MTEAQARTRIEAMTAWSTEPALSSAEIDILVADARRADANGLVPDGYRAWAANTVYALGAIVVPSTRNGYYYTVTTAGTSGATAPTWPTSGTVASGTVVFTLTGAAWTETWDLNAAAAEGWRWKAAKAAGRVTVSTDGQSVSRSDYIAHCERMIDRYASRIVGVVPAYGAYSGTVDYGGVN